MKQLFYRVCNPETEQGLWYNFAGEFTGLIHNEFSFCQNAELKMDFDPELVGWLSATDDIDELYKWFSKEDIYELQKHGWYIHVYSVSKSKFYDRFQHYVICQETSKVIHKLILTPQSDSIQSAHERVCY